MQSSTAQDELLERALEISPEEFEHLCKIVVEKTETTTHIELTPFHGDGGIDIRGNIGRDFYNARFGVQVKQFSGNIGTPAMRSFIGALSQHNYQFGSFITSSEFNSGAIEIAQEQLAHPIKLITGNDLTTIMLNGELGVVQVSDEYEIDHDFWEIFGTTAEEENLVKSDAVPQADSFDVLNVVLRGLDKGYRFKYEILEYMVTNTGEDWTPRQADYYPQAAWALGYAHKDAEGEYEGRTMRQWGLTRDGQEYLSHLEQGNAEKVEESLVKHIRKSDIIQRILEQLKEKDQISHTELGEIIESVSQLNDTTANRRKGTVGNWLDRLPEVRKSRERNTYKYEYLKKNLGDF